MSSIACESCQDLSEEQKESDIMIRTIWKSPWTLKPKASWV